MREARWQEFALPSGTDERVWELYHENSKLGRLSESVSETEVLTRMKQFAESLPFLGYPIVELPAKGTPLGKSLHEAITTRTSTRTLTPAPITLDAVATLFHCAYGVTRDNAQTAFPRPFRVIPSAGAQYPLELFFHTAHILGLPAGLYHYSSSDHQLRRVREEDRTAQLTQCFVHPDIVRGATLLVFITALFERNTFKYGERGYRFTLLEAGHVAQNLNLSASALGFGSVNLGGYYDREVDDFLGLDGITHSTVYVVALGKNADEVCPTS